MPYTKYTVKNRQAVGQLKYQIKRFLRQAEECGTDPKQLDAIRALADDFFYAASGYTDFDDDGTPLDVPEPPGDYEGHPDNCRGLGLEHRWAPGDISGTDYCTKCGECRNPAATNLALRLKFGLPPS